jgi:hypothetical protein
MFCKDCRYWKETLYSMGECEEIKQNIDIELETGWDGGYVKNIETDSDFGCVLFRHKEVE